MSSPIRKLLKKNTLLYRKLTDSVNWRIRSKLKVGGNDWRSPLAVFQEICPLEAMLVDLQ